MPDPLALRELSDPGRVAATAALVSMASADGVADDEELLPLVGSLGLEDLDPDARQRVARALLVPEPVDALTPLSEAPVLVRFGLVLRMVEVAGSDAAIAPGEVAQLQAAAPILGVTFEQVGAMRAVLVDLEYAAARGPSDANWYAALMRAGGTAVGAGIPVGALTWCGMLRRLGGPLGPLERGLGLPIGTLKHWLDADGPPGPQLALLSEALQALDDLGDVTRESADLRARSLGRLSREG